MKKGILLIFLVFLLVLTFTYAQEEQTTITKEQVKCVFLNSDSEQKCYTGDGKFSCSGTGSCTAQVEGENGKTLDWKSSCGGYASTLIDGVDDSIEFKCEIQETTPTPTPAPTPTETTQEQVTCVFANSNSEQKCYNNYGGSGCAGIGTCIADVSGEKGMMLTWKSSCGGYAYTVVDGNNEYAEFNCQQTTTPTPTVTIS